MRDVLNFLKAVRYYGGFGASVKLLLISILTTGVKSSALKARMAVSFASAQIKDDQVFQAKFPKPTRSQISKLGTTPKITIIVPVYKTPLKYLQQAIDSVKNQTFSHWHMVLVDDNSQSQAISKMLKAAAKDDNRVRVIFRKSNGHISKAINDGLAATNTEFFTILDHDDVLHEDAIFWASKAIEDNPSTDYIYTDEDKLSADGGTHFGEFRKPDWSPEYFLGLMYTCHMSIFRTSKSLELGGFRNEFNGAQDYDLALRLTSATTEKIVHIPLVLYSWRSWNRSTAKSNKAKPYAEIAARKAVSEILTSQNENFSIEKSKFAGHHSVIFHPKGEPLVSIVIPTANGSINRRSALENHLDAIIQDLLHKTDYKNIEIIVVHNGNLTDQQTNFLNQQKQIKVILYEEAQFSLANKINQGAEFATGEYLLILNDDIRVTKPDWLDQMVGMVQRDHVGVVAPRLLFPNKTIQHAGVVLLRGLPGHVYYGASKNSPGYGMGLQLSRNYSAVTGACSITPLKLFRELNGYSTKYPLNYNDVDYCLRAAQLGYRSVYLATTELLHFEGVSKAGGRSVANEEIQQFQKDWGSQFHLDPLYGMQLNQSLPY